MALMAALTVAGTGPAYAQNAQASTPSSEKALAETPAHPPAPLGWAFYPGISAGLTYDSNVFATPDDPRGDMLATYSPFLVVRNTGKGHSLTLEAEGTAARYRTHTQENSDDYRFDASGSLSAGSSGKLFGGVGISRAHEDRTSPDDVFGVRPTVYTDTHGHVGIAERWGGFSLRTGATYNHLRFRDVASATGGIIDNADRNRQVLGLGARVGYGIAERTDVFLQGTFDRRRYDRPVDDYGYRRDSQGGSWALGLSRRGPGSLQGELYLGRRMQRYDDPRLQDVSVPTWGARASWVGAGQTRFNVFVERSIEETTLPGASSFLDTAVGLRADRQVTGRLSTHASLTFTRSDFRGIDRRDDIADTGVGLSYRLARHVALDADYRLLQRHSNERTADYYRHEIYLGIRVDRGSSLFDAAGSTASSQGGGTASPRGFYFGLAPGYDMLATTVSSARGSHGSDGGQFAQGGPSATAFAGFGWTFGHLYTGLEVDGARSRARWDHTKTPDSRIYAAELDKDLGVTLDVGYVLPSSGVAFASVGRRRGYLSSSYAPLGDVVFAQDNTRMGTRYGVGLDVPVSRHLFVRTRYDVTRYGTYDVVYDGGVDAFDSSVARFQLGMGWRFGAMNPVQQGTDSIDGFYAGAQGGDDRSLARLDAVHRRWKAPTVTTFQADFGARGDDFGAFTGYGHAFGPLYAGLEIETDASRAVWSHTKDPGGRDFSVETRGSYGAALRLGFKAPGDALIYVRAGRVRSRFQTSYVKGNNADTWVERDDSRAGTRFGIGVETPLTRSLFLRLDYTTTRYAAIAFTTTQATPDDVRFAPRQQLVRLGLGMRFGGSSSQQ